MTTKEIRTLTTLVQHESYADALLRLCYHAVARGLAVAPFESRFIELDDGYVLGELPVKADPDFAVFSRHCPPTWIDSEWTEEDAEYFARTKDEPSNLQMLNDDGTYSPWSEDD